MTHGGGAGCGSFVVPGFWCLYIISVVVVVWGADPGVYGVPGGSVCWFWVATFGVGLLEVGWSPSALDHIARRRGMGVEWFVLCLLFSGDSVDP